MLINEEEFRKIANSYYWMFSGAEKDYDIGWGFNDCCDVVVSALKASSIKNDAKKLEEIVSAINKLNGVVFEVFCPNG